MAGNPEQSQPPAPVAETAATSNRNQSETTALYIGDLEANVKESQLSELFGQIGLVESVRVCKPKSDAEKPIGYGYINYINSEDAETALKKLNLSVLNGKAIRVMQSHGNRGLRDGGNEGGTVFIKNLDKAIDSKEIYKLFKEFGCVLSCKVEIDDEGVSKGYAFVQFENEESARNAVEKVDGIELNGKRISVEPYLKRVERVGIAAEEASVYVKNFEEEVTEEDLRRIFGSFGKVSSVKVMRDVNGKSRCFGFVNFVSIQDSSKAIEALDGFTFHNKEWYVGKARKKGEVEENCDQSSDDNYQQGRTLYVKNLNGRIDEDMLSKLFAPYGYITSVKVVRYANGKSKGVAFVTFSTLDEAFKALAEMNGKVVAGKPLYVAIAESKTERMAKQQKNFSQRPASALPSVEHQTPMNTPMPLLNQGGLFHQNISPFIPQRAFRYPQQLAPANLLNEPLFPNLFPLQDQMHEVLLLGIGRGTAIAPLHQAPKSPHTIRNFTTTPANASPE